MNFEEKLPKSIIVHIDRFSLSRDLQLEALQEFKELCLSSGTEVCAEVSGKIDRPSPNFFVKQGKVEEIKELFNLFNFSLLYKKIGRRSIYLARYLCAYFSTGR